MAFWHIFSWIQYQAKISTKPATHSNSWKRGKGDVTHCVAAPLKFCPILAGYKNSLTQRCQVSVIKENKWFRWQLGLLQNIQTVSIMWSFSTVIFCTGQTMTRKFPFSLPVQPHRVTLDYFQSWANATWVHLQAGCSDALQIIEDPNSAWTSVSLETHVGTGDQRTRQGQNLEYDETAFGYGV